MSPRLTPRQRMLEPLVEQHAVGKAGQRVVQRHVHDLGLRPALLGDVHVGSDETAVVERRASYIEDGAVWTLAHEDMRLTFPCKSHAGSNLLFGISGPVLATVRIETEYVLDRWRAAGKQSVGKIEQAARLLIAQDNPEVVVEEGNAAREVVDDGLQLGCALAQQAIVLLEQGIELLPLGNVFVRDHMAAVRRLAAPHIDDASVSKLVDARGCLVEFFDQIVDEMFGAGRIVAAARHAILEQLAERGSRFYLFAGQAVHLSIAIVADHQLLLAIEHGQALRHVVQGRIELLVLLLQPLLHQLDVALDARPAAVMLSFGDPDAVHRPDQGAGCKIICQVQTLAQAKQAAAAGADIIIAQGRDAGGHSGTTRGTMGLFPAVVDAVAPIPVVAAGGIADGRGLAAALALGAAGVSMGTRFTASRESLWDQAMKAATLAAGGDQTEQTRVFDVVRGAPWPAIYPGRALRNAFSARWHGREDALAADQQAQENAYLATAPDDFATRVVWAGEGVDLVNDIPTAAEIIERIVAQAAATLTQGARLVRESRLDLNPRRPCTLSLHRHYR